MSLRWSWRWAAAFLLLVLVLHEAHELVHTWLGRAVCGGWGERDFNTWSLAEGCEALAPTAAGPVFTYLVLWFGAALLLFGGRTVRYAGVALLFGANPLARLLTVGLGGGDELVVAVEVAGDEATFGLWAVTLGIVTLVCAPPLAVAWRGLRPTRRRWLWFAGLFIAPTLAVVALLLVGMNSLLGAGVLREPVVMGEPLLVFLTTAVTFVLCGLAAPWLLRPAGASSESP